MGRSGARKVAVVGAGLAGLGAAWELRRRGFEVTVLDVYKDTAAVKIDSTHFMDYVHMVKWDGRWVILNVLCGRCDRAHVPKSPPTRGLPSSRMSHPT